MGALIASFGVWFLGSALARILTGAGLTLVTATWVSGLIDSALNTVASSWSGISGDVLAFLAYSGLGTPISIVGSAILARAAISAAAGLLGVAKV